MFDSINSFDSRFASDIGVSGNGFLLASYFAGTPGVLTTADDAIMFVNGFPATQDDYPGSDFGLLFANALALPAPGAIALFLVAGLAERRRRV